EYFSNIPQRNYLVRGIKVKVPSNYDPIARSYSGLWDGRFKIAWTNNPAWIFYDLLTNKRYGMGQRLGDFSVDKWALYAIGQYCDVSVPDGFGGKEPRMTCNCWLTEQRQAYELINDLASIFRAMPVWNGQQLTAIQDRPSDPVWTYTNANVVNGEFERSYSALKARHNIIHVEYLDKNDFYEKKIEYVSDDGAVKRYGANVKKVTAFGCTSRGQAYRLGRWILETEKLEKETITFSVGREGLMHLPGDIIRVADNHYAGTNIGGRVLAVKGREVTLDREIDINGASYFSYINAEATQQTIKIQAVNGSIITLDSTPTGLTEFGVWSLATSAVRGGLYRAVSISENENGSYTITALQHEPQKEAIVDNGAHFEAVSKTLYSAPQLTDVVINTASGTGAVINAEVTAGNAIITRYDILIYQGEKLYQSYIGQ
ncbi:host specificity protein J, partial [Gallibacterium anatis]